MAERKSKKRDGDDDDDDALVMAMNKLSLSSDDDEKKTKKKSPSDHKDASSDSDTDSDSGSESGDDDDDDDDDNKDDDHASDDDSDSNSGSDNDNSDDVDDDAPVLLLETFSRRTLKKFGVKVEQGRTAKKRGSRAKRTAGAHQTSFEVINSVYAPMVAADPSTAFTRDEAQRMVRAMNRDANIRIKTMRGNLWGTGTGYPGDRELDKKLREAFDVIITTGDTVVVSEFAWDRLGRMAKTIFHDDVPDRFKLRFVRTVFKVRIRYPPLLLRKQDGSIDERSAGVRSGAVLFTKDGRIDARSSAVKSGDLMVRDDGRPDGRSRAFNARVENPWRS